MPTSTILDGVNNFGWQNKWLVGLQLWQDTVSYDISIQGNNWTLGSLFTNTADVLIHDADTNTGRFIYVLDIDNNSLISKTSTIKLNSTRIAYFDGCEGKNTINLSGSSEIANLTSFSGDDEITMTDNSIIISALLGSGDNFFQSSINYVAQVSAQNGNDHIIIGQGGMGQVNLQSGTNFIESSGLSTKISTTESIVCYEGNDSVIATYSRIGNINLGSGNDRIDGENSEFNSISMGTGNDELTINNSTIEQAGLGAGTDKLTLLSNINNYSNSSVGLIHVIGGSDIDTLDTSALTIDQVIRMDDGWVASDRFPNVAFSTNFSSFEIIIGGSGNDQLRGSYRPLETIIGGAGDDLLEGVSGSDLMKGGEGHDTLVGGDGIDTADYSDKTSSVVLTLAGKSASIATINGLMEDQLSDIENIIGGSANDMLTGDIYSNSLKGNAGIDNLKGAAGDDILDGGAGSDKLWGGTGNDTLTGGIGNDLFIFNAPLNINTNIDTVIDFNQINDTISLENAIMTGLGTLAGALSQGAFHSGSGVTAAHDLSDRIIYNSDTGDLYYDADGTGATGPIQFARIGVASHPVINYTDFVIS